jgi:hypothetical protein
VLHNTGQDAEWQGNNQTLEQFFAQQLLPDWVDAIRFTIL